MTFSNPAQNLVLSYAIQKWRNEMFAGATGFSGPEMVAFFSRHDINIEQYSRSGGMPSRKQIFEDCLSCFNRASLLHRARRRWTPRQGLQERPVWVIWQWPEQAGFGSRGLSGRPDV